MDNLIKNSSELENIDSNTPLPYFGVGPFLLFLLAALLSYCFANPFFGIISQITHYNIKYLYLISRDGPLIIIVSTVHAYLFLRYSLKDIKWFLYYFFLIPFVFFGLLIGFRHHGTSALSSFRLLIVSFFVLMASYLLSKQTKQDIQVISYHFVMKLYVIIVTMYAIMLMLEAAEFHIAHFSFPGNEVINNFYRDIFSYQGISIPANNYSGLIGRRFSTIYFEPVGLSLFMVPPFLYILSKKITTSSICFLLLILGGIFFSASSLAFLFVVTLIFARFLEFIGRRSYIFFIFIGVLLNLTLLLLNSSGHTIMSSGGHLSALFEGVKTVFLKHYYFGMGIGSGGLWGISSDNSSIGAGDSYLGLSLKEVGFFTFGIYFLFIALLRKNINKSSSTLKYLSNILFLMILLSTPYSGAAFVGDSFQIFYLLYFISDINAC